MISIDAKPLETEIEIKGYGIFRVRRLGAGQEAEATARLDEARSSIDSIAKRYKALFDKEKELVKNKDELGLSELKKSPAYQKAMAEQKASSEKLEAVMGYVNKVHLGLWSSDDSEALTRLFNDFTFKQLGQFYRQAIAEADKA